MDQGICSIGQRRLRTQHLIGPPLAGPVEVVRWLGAVQAQDFPAAKWGVAQRTKRCRDDELEAAFASGGILRTHVLRPTWHFVLPEDIRWLLALSAPRIRAFMRYHDAKLEIDAKLIARSEPVLARALAGGQHATRGELRRALAAAKISADGQRLGHLLMHAELSALICSGPRRGKQFTYALLDARAAVAGAPLARDEALARLALRYFRAHGPAQVHDFAWWAGLTVGDAQAGIAAASAELTREELEGVTFWSGAERPARVPAGDAVHLLPNYDELVIAYKDHAPSFAAEHRAELGSLAHYFTRHVVVRNGHVVGGWRVDQKRGAAQIQARLLTPFDHAGKAALELARERYAKFLDCDVQLTVT